MSELMYMVLSRVALPFVWLRLWIRGRREPAYRERRGERLGFVHAAVPRQVVWFHTVSTGEALGAVPLIRSIKRALPDVPFLVTTTTPSGSVEVRKHLGAEVEHCYCPYDFPKAVRRFMDSVEPRALVLMETELWPNTIRECRRRNVPVYLVNARLSERSATGYQRLTALMGSVLTNMTHIYCQYQDTADRFAALGVEREILSVTGSVKFDLQFPSDIDSRRAEFENNWQFGKRIWIAGSTHPGEEEVVLQAHKRLLQQHRDLSLILVPRHPPRASEVVRLARTYGFDVAVLSSDPKPSDVLVGDEMGTLIYLYAAAEVAFVGGSLDDTGGHNPIEAAIHGVPMIMGPNCINFAQVVQRFEAAGCLHLADNVDELTNCVDELLRDADQREVEGHAARQVVSNNRGAIERVSSDLSRRLAG
ncbi:MAG: lipid IV(A) 3-deoxy-D-manno-octulosonic acid transferase [Pseudomonadota bacterium]|nr:lipid IV(A) 3-deoxy-D-manno-octulosonic acid transferase [Pseudomonadota bacterium]